MKFQDITFHPMIQQRRFLICFGNARIFSLPIALTVTIALIALSCYIGWRAIAGDKKYAIIRSIAITICSLGGTRFRGANLTDADFTSATLKHTDLRGAIK